MRRIHDTLALFCNAHHLNYRRRRCRCRVAVAATIATAPSAPGCFEVASRSCLLLTVVRGPLLLERAVGRNRGPRLDAASRRKYFDGCLRQHTSSAWPSAAQWQRAVQAPQWRIFTALKKQLIEKGSLSISLIYQYMATLGPCSHLGLSMNAMGGRLVLWREGARAALRGLFDPHA